MTTEKLTIHDGRTDVSPEDVGLDWKRLQLLDEHFSRLITEKKLQGASYLIARDGQIALHRSMGKLTNKEDSVDFLPDSVRKVFSITKAVTAVAVMQLVEEGKLFLQQPVADLIKEFNTDMHRSITIWHLLTHTSGIYGDGGQNSEPYSLPDSGWRAFEKKKTAASWESGDWIKLLLSGPMRNKPGVEWIYNSSGFSVLGEIIARVSGMSFENYVHERLHQPLGMERSFFDVPENLKKETCYTAKWDEKDIFDPWDQTGMPPRGGGGLYSTLEDMWKFGQAMLDGGSFRDTQILGKKMVNMMAANQLKNVRTDSWGMVNRLFEHGLGFSLNRDDLCTPGTFGHEGYGRSGLYIDPKERLVFVYFVPSSHDWVPEAMIHPRAIVWSSIL